MSDPDPPRSLLDGPSDATIQRMKESRLMSNTDKKEKAMTPQNVLPDTDKKEKAMTPQNVLPDTDSTVANERYGERYWVDWQYAEEDDPEQMLEAHQERLSCLLAEALCKHSYLGDWFEYADTVLAEPMVLVQMERFTRAVLVTDALADARTATAGRLV